MGAVHMSNLTHFGLEVREVVRAGPLVGSADRDVDIDESVDLFMFSGYLQGCPLVMEYNDPQPTVSAHIGETSREPPKCDLSALRFSMLAAW